MRRTSWMLFAAPMSLLLSIHFAVGSEFAAPLPNDVQAVWDVDKAFRETTTTARADLHQRPVALAAGRRRAGDDAHGKLGLLQGSRLLARYHRLHAEGLPDGRRASELEGPATLEASPRRGTSARSPSPPSGTAAASRSRSSISIRLPWSTSTASRRASCGFPAAKWISRRCASRARHTGSPCTWRPCRSRA